MSFGAQLRAYAEKQKRNIEEVYVESVVDLSASVIVKTPVAFGHLAANWQPTETAPATGERPGNEYAGQMQDVENAVAAAFGGVYFLVNNVPYAHDIEFNGRSLKAPQGMLRVSIENYQQYLDNAVSKLP